MRETTRKGKLLNLIDDFRNKKVLVIGDYILDAETDLELTGAALELPIPRYKFLSTAFSHGGAGNVVKNLAELGAEVSFVTLLGEDYYSSEARKWHPNVTFLPVIEAGRKTTVKQRFWVRHRENQYPLFKINQQSEEVVGEETKDKILDEVKKQLRSRDIVILADYRHGMLNEPLIDGLLFYKSQGKTWIASSQVSQKDSNHHLYSGVDLICMNQKEAEEVMTAAEVSNISSPCLFHNLEEVLHSNICITSGEKGSVLYLNGKKYKTEGIKVKEVDSCGAGDSFLSAFALSDYKKNPREALYLANVWAGLSVQQRGTKVPLKEELIKFINGN